MHFWPFRWFKLQELAGIIKLSAFSSFSLFECRKAVVSKSPDPGNGTYANLFSWNCGGKTCFQFSIVLFNNTFSYFMQRSISVWMIISILEIYLLTLRLQRTEVRGKSYTVNSFSKRSYFGSQMKLLQTQCSCNYRMSKYVF